MVTTCGNCQASTAREPLCEVCNDEDNALTDKLVAEVERLQARIADDALTIAALRDELTFERTKLAACAVVAQGSSFGDLIRWMQDNSKPESKL